MKEPDLWEYVRNNIIGRSTTIKTPFGKRLITYADYTASGRGLYFIENYLTDLMKLYGNTHTEDDATGIASTVMLKEAEQKIKCLVNADVHYKIIQEGYGSTGAIHRLQKILGIYIPPVLRENLRKWINEYYGNKKEQKDGLVDYIKSKRPVVFVGPYEHHSNELTWREGFCEVIEIELNSQGLIDLADLEKKLARYNNENRIKIGSFSACSNVTGIKSPVYEIAKILHNHGAYAFIDFSASAPYIDIDVRRDRDSYFDSIFFSPHKFLGGPGSCGILILHEKLYRTDLPPTCSGGGTVDYVGFTTQLYSSDIEIREKPGTPGILQMIKAALAMELKERLGVERIEEREYELIARAMSYLSSIPEVEILGNPDPSKRIGIISFNIVVGDGYLHPRFIVKLLNDLFGIQARAGCSCAGPYGHRLLHIDFEKSMKYRKLIQDGFAGLKPGWARISFHYLMTDDEVEFILNAISFIAKNGRYFLPLYFFDIHTGSWKKRNFKGIISSSAVNGLEIGPFGIEGAFRISEKTESLEGERKNYYMGYISSAEEVAKRLKKDFSEKQLKETEDDLISFVYYDIL